MCKVDKELVITDGAERKNILLEGEYYKSSLRTDLGTGHIKYFHS